METVMLSAAETQDTAAALSLTGQLDRVRGIQEETTKEIEIKRISGGPVQHLPTMAFRLRDVHYLHGVAYSRTISHRQMLGKNSLIGRVGTDIASASLISTTVGSRYFGHHVVDDAATTLMAAPFAQAFRAQSAAVESWPHAAVYRNRMGVDSPALGSARIGDAWIFDDRGMTQHRRQRVESLRAALRDGPGIRSGHGVFLRRRGGGVARVLDNEEEIENRLRAVGFDIIDPATDTAETIILHCRDASIICGVEGSGLAHGLLGAAPTATIFVLQHPWRFNNLWKTFTDLLGMRYAYLVGEGNPRSFRIDPDEVMATLDLLQHPAGAFPGEGF